MNEPGWIPRKLHALKKKNQWRALPGGSGAKTPRAPNAVGPGFDHWPEN